jgi:hypothetical protein
VSHRRRNRNSPPAHPIHDLQRCPLAHRQHELEPRARHPHEQLAQRLLVERLEIDLGKISAGADCPLKRYTDSASNPPSRNTGVPNKSYAPVNERSECASLRRSSCR